jgi:hypothetical protein
LGVARRWTACSPYLSSLQPSSSAVHKPGMAPLLSNKAVAVCFAFPSWKTPPPATHHFIRILAGGPRIPCTARSEQWLGQPPIPRGTTRPRRTRTAQLPWQSGPAAGMESCNIRSLAAIAAAAEGVAGSPAERAAPAEGSLTWDETVAGEARLLRHAPPLWAKQVFRVGCAPSGGPPIHGNVGLAKVPHGAPRPHWWRVCRPGEQEGFQTAHSNNMQGRCKCRQHRHQRQRWVLPRGASGGAGMRP